MRGLKILGIVVAFVLVLVMDGNLLEGHVLLAVEAGVWTRPIVRKEDLSIASVVHDGSWASPVTGAEHGMRIGPSD
ncbi:MAG: hypothetical protein OK454_05295 [Thaumarchaeota archaeon]|nr:hypothetical protein [Nitrososphaerota archaeon]